MPHDLNAILQYVRQPHTDYAIMLTGPWGCGKTYFWKNTVAPTIKAERSKKPESFPTPAYVSLFGITEPEQIQESIIAQLHPTLEKAGDVATVFGKAILKHAKLEEFTEALHPKNWIRRLTNHREPLVVCLDDLERSPMPQVAIFGQINQMVEHLGAKVVLLCNEKELTKNFKEGEMERYLVEKEKAVRLTREFSPEEEEMLDAIIKGYADDKKFHDYLKSQRTTISRTFKSNKTKNLRVLKFALTSLEAVFSTIGGSGLERSNWVSRLMPSLLPVAMDTQSGLLPKLEAQYILRNGAPAIFAAHIGDKKNSSPLREFEERHGPFGLFDTLIRSEALATYIGSGYLDEKKLLQEIERDSEELTPEHAAIKAIMYDPFELDDASLEGAIAMTLEALAKHEIADWEDLARIARSLTCLSRIPDPPIDEAEIRPAFEATVAGLKENGEFKIIQPHFMAAKKLDHYVEDMDSLKWLPELLTATNAEAIRKELAQTIEQATSAIDNNPIEFARIISSQEEGGIANQPISQYVDATTFCNAFLKCNNEGKRLLCSAIQSRYENSSNRHTLMADREWLKSVLEGANASLDKAAKGQSLSRWHTDRLAKIITGLIRLQSDNTS